MTRLEGVSGILDDLDLSKSLLHPHYEQSLCSEEMLWNCFVPRTSLYRKALASQYQQCHLNLNLVIFNF